jgi:putative transposase
MAPVPLTLSIAPAILLAGLDNLYDAHVRTSPYDPRSNGKIERWHKSLKGECFRPRTPLSLDDARRVVQGYVEPYNNPRLNSAIGYITPKDMLAGRQQEIHAERDRKLEAAREQRQTRRQQAA